jgi:hypothetical protein
MTDKPKKPSYLGSLIDSWSKRQLFDEVQHYCMFFGYPGSGHSLVGSLMDAHPNMIISHELDALEYLRKGFNQNQLFSLIMQRSAEFTQEGRLWTGHNYSVEGQWQGRYEQDLVVIGDKKGGRSSRYLEFKPDMLTRLLSKIDKPITFIHVTRNPYDNISTMTRRSGRPLPKSMEIYFRRAAGVQNAKDLTGSYTWVDIRHEDVIANTAEVLQQLCALFDLPCSQEYLQACAGLVFPSPRKTRENQPWDTDLVAAVAERIRDYPFLQSYTYED